MALTFWLIVAYHQIVVNILKMLVKSNLFKKQVKIDYHATRRFYNLIHGSILQNCGCTLCLELIKKLAPCAECASDLNTIGVELFKPISMSCTKIDNLFYCSLVYIVSGRLFKAFEGAGYGSIIRYKCNNCNIGYFVDDDFSKVNSLYLKVEFEIDLKSFDSSTVNERHLRDIM